MILNTVWLAAESNCKIGWNANNNTDLFIAVAEDFESCIHVYIHHVLAVLFDFRLKLSA